MVLGDVLKGTFHNCAGFVYCINFETYKAKVCYINSILGRHKAYLFQAETSWIQVQGLIFSSLVGQGVFYFSFFVCGLTSSL
jgi:hypothetical protein